MKKKKHKLVIHERKNNCFVFFVDLSETGLGRTVKEAKKDLRNRLLEKCKMAKKQIKTFNEAIKCI